MYDSESTTFAQRIVLCCLVDCAEDDRTPIDSATIRETARKLLENTENAPVGSLSEADVTRALNGLVGADLVEEQRPESRSPVGKGRPKYELRIETETLRGKLCDDADMAPLLN